MEENKKLSFEYIVIKVPMRHPRMMGIKHEALERDLDRMCVFTMGSEIVIKATDIN